MSSRIKRFRKASCETPKMRKESVLLNSAKNRSSSYSHLVHFESETLSSSSPQKVDKTSEKKVRRKKIRSTQDFNKLNSSCTEESDSSAKSKTKRTRKAQGMYNLPKIENVVEDFSRLPSERLNTKDSMLRRKSKRKTSQINNKEKDDYSDAVNNEIKKGEFTKDKSSRRTKPIVNQVSNSSLVDIGAFESQLCDVKTNSNFEHKTNESKNSLITDEQKHTKEDTRIKTKKKLRKKSKSNTCTEYKNDCTMPIIKNSNLPDKETDVHSPSLNGSSITFFSQVSPRRDQRRTPSRVSSTQTSLKHHKQQCKNTDNFIELASNVMQPTFAVEMIPVGGQKVLTPSKLKSTASCGRMQKRNLPGQDYDSPLTFLDISDVKRIDTSKVNKRRRWKTSEASGSFLESINIADISADDVFDVSAANDSSCCLETNNSSKTVKVVGDRNLSESKINLQSPIDQGTDSIVRTPSMHKNFSGNYPEESSTLSNNSSVTHRRSTFTVEVPLNEHKVLTTSKLNSTAAGGGEMQKKNVSGQNCDSPWRLSAISISSNEELSARNDSSCYLETKDPSTTLNVMRDRDLSKSKINLQSPISKKTNLVNTTSPSICKNFSGNNAKELSLINSPSILHRESTFTVEIPVSEQKVLTNSKLNRTVTGGQMRKKNLPAQHCDSPLAFFDISGVKNVDTSKVNKRRRWNTSQANVSFLDSTYIADISAPWNEVSHLSAADDSNRLSSTTSKVVRDAGLSGSKINLQSPSGKRTGSMIRTPPSKTSTPFPKSKNVLLKQTLLKDKRNVTVDESKNSSKTVEKPKRKKMPNFALIHQRAFDKMENLKEMSERKAIRAKLLLSGHKPTDQSYSKSPSKSKKFLQFSPAKPKIVPLTTSTSENRTATEKLNKFDILVTKSKNISPSTSNLKVVSKENKVTLLVKKKATKSSQIPKLKLPNVAAEKKGFTRYGFKVGQNAVKPVTKEDQMKAVTTKTKILKNTVEERRNVIQGVRSNRRFELLMRMRMK